MPKDNEASGQQLILNIRKNKSLILIKTKLPKRNKLYIYFRMRETEINL